MSAESPSMVVVSFKSPQNNSADAPFDSIERLAEQMLACARLARTSVLTLACADSVKEARVILDGAFQEVRAQMPDFDSPSELIARSLRELLVLREVRATH